MQKKEPRAASLLQRMKPPITRSLTGAVRGELTPRLLQRDGWREGGQVGVTTVTRKFYPSSGDGLKSFISRWYDSSNESWSFQLVKSGMKYSRISRAMSLPVSASNAFHRRLLRHR